MAGFDEYEAWNDLGRSLGASPATVVKASSGVGQMMMTYDAPLNASLPRQQQKLMHEAQALYHRNPWVAAAERAIVGRVVRLGWHLEQPDGDTVDDSAPANQRAVLELLDKPSPERKLTRRWLWSLTLRHLGLCGNSFWYLDQTERLAGTPLQVLYINPVRMTPAEDSGGNLLGWVLDAPDNPVSGRAGSGGTPLDVDQVIHFTLDPPDAGVWGIGIAEAVAANIELSRLATQHASKTLASGGRIAGILMPNSQTGSVNDDQWAQLSREYRNIVNDPDSAKRLQILKVPMDFTQTAATAEQMQLESLLTASRDDVLNAWGVPLTTIGIPTPTGLNSGERGKYDEAALWQGPIDHRVHPFLESIQHNLIDRYQALGIDLTLVLETPKFDDQTPLYDLGEKAQWLPLTWDERRAVVGQDPLDPKVYGDLGGQVYVNQTLVPIGGSLTPVTTAPADAAPVAAKAARSQYAGLRAGVERTFVPAVRRAVAQLLAEQKADVVARVRDKGDAIARKPRDTDAWWRGPYWTKRLRELLTPEYAALALHVSGRIIRDLKAPAKGDAFLDALLERIWSKGADRVVGITDTTRDQVRDFIAAGLKDGLSPPEIADRLEDAAMFDASRADLIARTETALAYNAAALGSYQELGVEEVEAVDGDGDEECAARDGQTFSLDEAEAIEDHPNGTLDWIPLAASISESKATSEDDYVKPEDLAAIQRTIAEAFAKASGGIGGGSVQLVMPSAPAPHVDVHVPETQVTVNVPQQPTPRIRVDVPAPNVTVQPPKIEMPVPAKAEGPQQVEVTSMPPRKHVAVRDKSGKVEGSIESDA